MKKIFTLFLFFCSGTLLNAQQFYQYFDGADTIPFYSIAVQLDTSSSNVWQIGPPQKNIFDSASTAPNVIVTDTINYYPVNNYSAFTISVDASVFGPWGIMALQWKQKLDLDLHQDGGFIEYSLDTGQTWHNAFNDPQVYNFYGFDTINKDTLNNGLVAFSGTDSTWKDIWLCFDNSFLQSFPMMLFRFSLVSDSTDNQKEGWMIDNMISHITTIHTAGGPQQEEYLRVYPNSTSGILYIEAKKLQEYHVIEHMELYASDGRLLQKYGLAPTKYFIDISKYPDGVYYLKITTNKETQTFPVILKR